MDNQKIIYASDNYFELDNYLMTNKIKKIFLVCGNSIKYLNLGKYFNDLPDRIGIEVIKFSDFQPNPLYESVALGVRSFNESCSDIIIAVGGGSAIDVAKCIKLYSNMNHTLNYLKQKIIPNNIPLIAIPTTAGTGSEATRYAVIYYNGEKQSVTDPSCIPSLIVFDSSALKTLPDFQKKSTMLDALSHSLESFWSINSTEMSRKYSKEALQLILSNMDEYLNNTDVGNEKMLHASYIAGKAINLTQTTAGHAMCYKLTSMYNIPHGYAAALVNTKLWSWMIDHLDKCTDERGVGYLQNCFNDIALVMGADNASHAADLFQKLLDSLEMPKISAFNKEDITVLKNSVNTIRLKNNPVQLDLEDIEFIYKEILF